MHTWPSKKVMKTNKNWHTVYPKGLTPEQHKDYTEAERDYKRTMLGLFVKEKKAAGK